MTRPVALRVAYSEMTVRHRVKQAGGKWDRDRKVWELRYDRTVALGLTDRIVPDPVSTSRFREPRAEYLYADTDSGIQMEMLASTVGCWHPVADARVAVEY